MNSDSKVARSDMKPLQPQAAFLNQKQFKEVTEEARIAEVVAKNGFDFPKNAAAPADTPRSLNSKALPKAGAPAKPHSQVLAEKHANIQSQISQGQGVPKLNKLETHVRSRAQAN
mmetsp:Transcript_16214/g.27431  ORF Transcript_16214/g.27431 Transcript_16214/m.27431 type:complete len:115 (-) Transcript_16214:259-603(-)